MTKAKPSKQSGCKQYSLAKIGILVALPFIGVGTSSAAEWRIEPIFRAGYEFDDNATLNTVAAPAEIEGYILDGSATFGYATERTTFDITPTLRTRDYDDDIDDEAFDSDDYFLDFDFDHEGIKSNFRFRGSYGSESVRTAERADANPDDDDPDEIPGDDTGRVFLNDKRDRIWIFPQWRYRFSEKLGFDASVSYTDVDYDESLAGFFVPFSDARVEVSLYRRFTPRTRWHIKAGARSYEPESDIVNEAVDIDGAAVNVGFDTRLTETFRFRAEVGVEETEPDGAESESEVVWNINLVKRLETGSFMAQYRRGVNPGGSGRVSLRDSFNLSFTRPFSERFRLGLGVRAYTTEQLTGDDDRDYIQFRARLTYAILRTFSIEADYRYTYQDRSEFANIGDTSGDSNGIILWLIYQPRTITTSR
jgi:hypothetical protein